MSKRFGNFSGFTSSVVKKPKMDNIDDLWGDDLDINDVDDCLILASQVYDQPTAPLTQLNNVSILPTYEGFKQNLFTSTQKNFEMHLPSVSQTQPLNGTPTTLKRSQSFGLTLKEPETEVKYRKLEEQYESKVGEVSILRSNLTDLRSYNEAEQKKVQKEWNEKLVEKSKQLQAVESQLEFKNLEIINLTQKLKEATKINNLHKGDTVSSPFFKSSVTNKTIRNAEAKDQVICTEYRIYKTAETKYPLKETIDLNVFRVPVIEMCVKDIDCRFKCPTLQSFVVKSQPILNASKDCQFDTIYDSMKLLRGCNESQLAQNTEDIDKLWVVSIHLISNLHQFLQGLEIDMKVSDSGNVLNLERIFMDETVSRESQDEMGTYATQSMLCLSELVPYSNTITQYFSHNEKNRQSRGSIYLSLTLLLVKLVRKLQLCSNFTLLFEALIKLLSKICMNFKIENLDSSNIVYDITKEIILCVPCGGLMPHFLQYFCELVVRCHCLPRFCAKYDEKELKIDRRMQTIVCEKQTCILNILFSLLEEAMKIHSKLSGSVMRFISSCLRCNQEWFTHKENKRCACISKATRLYVDLMYKMVQRVTSLNPDCNTDEINRDCEILKGGVDTLMFLNSTLFDVVAKYMPTYSRYTVIIATLLELRDTLNLSDLKVQVLDGLSKNEEVHKVDEERFKEFCDELLS